MTPSNHHHHSPPPYFVKKQWFFYNEAILKDIVSLTLTLGSKNKKQPFGPTELDLEAGNLVSFTNVDIF